MTTITYINTGKPRRNINGSLWRIVDARLRSLALFFLAFAALWRFPGLGTGELQKWDEAIYALRLQVILRFGELWDQSAYMLSGSYFSAHPPLYVWLSLCWTLIFGDAVWVHRLTSALAAAALVILVYRSARHVLPRTFATLTGMLVGCMPLLAVYSRRGQLDVLLSLFMLAALWAGAMYIRDGYRRHLAAGALFLGAALMTKMLFALSVPAGILCSGLLLKEKERRRAVVFAVFTFGLALPLWLPWLWSFVQQHGGGSLSYLFSSAVPLGATLGGQEGTVKETGLLYYPNQLAIHLSALLPFALFAMMRTLRSRRPLFLLPFTVWLLFQFVVLLIVGSSFQVYLLVMLAPLTLFAVYGVQLARKASLLSRRILLLLSAFCFVWSLSQDWRLAVKHFVGIASSPLVPSGTLVDLLLFFTVLIILLYITFRCVSAVSATKIFSSTSLWLLTVGFLAVGIREYYFIEPVEMDDGAAAVAEYVQSVQPVYTAIIGNHENPQLTWYLGGADIGWAGDAPGIIRLEPRTLGMGAVQERLVSMTENLPAVAIIELKEVSRGISRTAEEILPPGYHIELSTRRYIVARAGHAAY